VLPIDSPPATACDRRDWLRLALLSGLGVSVRPWTWLPGTRAASSAGGSPGFGKAKSVIVVFASGGQSQLDTWDPKPHAPEEIRGVFRPIATSVPGTYLSEHLPRVARLAHLYTIVRSVHHDDLDHGSAAYLALTGQPHPRKSSNPPPQATDYPTLGAVIQRVRPSPRLPYTAIHVNGPALVPELPAPGQNAGFLGHGYDPLVLGDVTAPVTVGGLDPLPELPATRRDSRRGLLRSLQGVDRDPVAQQAYDLLASKACREAFDLGREPLAVRERYGLHRSGQACLLARRLAEAGVPYINVIWNQSNRGQDKHPEATDAYGWDTHNDIFMALREHLLPRFDGTFSALLSDLQQRGTLDQTLVVCMGEFGRAPRVALEPRFAGASPGRKHWAGVYSVVLAGAGVGGGAIVGASDRIGAYPSRDPVAPGDLIATLLASLGIDPGGHYADANGRPFPVATGEVITALYG
jgi:hypothetical protein